MEKTNEKSLTIEEINRLMKLADMLRNKLKTIDEIIEELDAETLKKVVLNKNVEKLVEHEALKRMCHESLDVLDEAALDIYCTLEEA